MQLSLQIIAISRYRKCISSPTWDTFAYLTILYPAHTDFNKHAIKMEPQIILTRQQDIKNTFIISS